MSKGCNGIVNNTPLIAYSLPHSTSAPSEVNIQSNFHRNSNRLPSLHCLLRRQLHVGCQATSDKRSTPNGCRCHYSCQKLKVYKMFHLTETSSNIFIRNNINRINIIFLMCNPKNNEEKINCKFRSKKLYNCTSFFSTLRWGAVKKLWQVHFVCASVLVKWIKNIFNLFSYFFFKKIKYLQYAECINKAHSW